VNHPDLIGAMKECWNLVPKDGALNDTVNPNSPLYRQCNDKDGHGTANAGIAAARTNNEKGVASVGNDAVGGGLGMRCVGSSHCPRGMGCMGFCNFL
jgi:hypothetical protein